MKLYSKIIHGCSQVAACSMLLFGMSACYDEKMDWNDDYKHPNFVDLPVELREQIDRYGILSEYAYMNTNEALFKLGAGIDFSLYTSDDAYRNLVNENFKDVTAGNEMKQASIMDSKGNLDFSKVDPTIEMLRSNGFSIYGHTLVWHTQQQASYLNSLIAPMVIPGAPGESALANGSFEEGMDGWGAWGGSKGNHEVTTEYAVDGSLSLKVPVLSAGDIWGVQVQSPAIPVVEGHRYQIAFYIKSDVPGAVRISFDNSLESEPLGNSFWPVNNDADFTSGNDKLFSTSPTWRQVIYDVNNLANDNEFIANTSSFQFRFDLGLVGEVTYYIDNITVVDLDSEDEFNYVENGNLESGDLAPMVALNPGDGITVTEEAKYSGTYGVKATASASSANEWDLQFQVPELILDSLKTYTMSFMVKSDGEGQGRISFPGLANEWPYQDWDGTGAKASFSTSSAWKQISFDFMPKYKPDVNAVKFNFDIGKVAGITYFIDDIKIVEKKEDLKSKSVLRAGPTIIEKTPEEKAQIIGDAMEKWISDMVGHYKGKVRAWDVVNEPINDNGTLRTGEGKELAADEFYWQDYLSWDYAVKAFNAAAAADPDAKLFINDFNLESTTPTKLDALIKYVEEIETKGARVDGIGTQMHLNINWSDTTGIKIMFEKLAATGKLIKVTELDVTFNTNANEDPASPIAPTLEQYDQQAELYRYVAEMYTRIIPENQQFGITVWGISDNEKEHQYWKKNDAPCLWDAKYVRKHAYKGFADGLAGKDVGAEFKQDEKWDGQ